MAIQVFHKNVDLQAFVKDWKSQGKRIGFVPTMGALHDGHLSLVLEAQKKADIIVCSIFVNPTQFNEKSDLDKYPRTLEKDVALLETVGCHAVYAPDAEEVYQNEIAYTFDFAGLDQVMEGPNRPGHFEGVVQVVKRLFEIVQPNVACFGLKDFQQFAILRHMTHYFDFDIELIGCPIIRESSGLAMSSRNMRLSDSEKERSLVLSRALHFARDNWSFYTVDEIKNLVINWLAVHSEVEYFEISDANSLQPVSNWEEAKEIRGFIATWVGNIRLIDNMRIK